MSFTRRIFSHLFFILSLFLLSYSSSSATTITYSTDSTFVVPAGVTTITVKAWGAGGSSVSTTYSGGGGGFVRTDIAVSSGQSYIVKVGGGGATTTTALNGGGSYGGGGYSGVFLSSVSQANARIIAAGGGGGSVVGAGGTGGGTAGGDGGGGPTNGSGATQSAGGASPGAGAGTGSALQGGTGTSINAPNVNGGGGGYFGGGGGYCTGLCAAGGGGGGSSYTSGINTVNTAASGGAVANSSDTDYPGSKGNGGSNGNGQPGYVVISYMTNQSVLTITSTSGVYPTAVSLTTSGGSGTGAVTYALVSAGTAGCSVAGTTLNYTSAGTCTVTATKAADATYNATTTATTTVTISKTNQATLTVTNTSGIYPTGFNLSSSGGSGTGAVTYALVSAGTAGCSVTSGGTMSFTSAGTCTVTATKAADTNYNAVTSATTTVTINSGIVVPTLNAPATSVVTGTGTTLTATITLNGGASITARGTCYGTSPSPLTNCVAEGGTATGTFSQARTGLTPGTLYYARAYATNSAGTGYSSDTPFVIYKNTYASDSTFTVPAGVSSITVKAWGAGGGGGNTTNVGGGGGFAQADISVSSGQSYVVAVGGAGIYGTTGGAHGGGASTAASLGSGGGFSGIFLSSISQANARVIAGGGGGGGGYTTTNNGGAGGGTTGASSAGYIVAGGGTQSAGGTGGAGGTTVGIAGSALQGGSGNDVAAGGGGGYYGGGGGGRTNALANGSGGGGSGYTSGLNTIKTAGSGQSVANSSDTDYPGSKGAGGATGGSGQAGYIVITYALPAYSITASAGTGGSISPTGSLSVAYGGSQTYTITATSSYVISSVTVDGTNLGALSSYTFSNVTAAHTISATFATTSATTTKVGYTANGTFTVPPGVSSITVKAWGAAGGSGRTAHSGGGGGYSKATLTVTPGQVLYVAVGGGGAQGFDTGAGYNIGGTNGGGDSGTAVSIGASGSGGGFSGIFTGATYSQANALVVAGGGGSATSQNDGAAGGGTSGQNGTGGAAGGGGTQSAGGTVSNGACAVGAIAGSALQGGTGGQYANGGGPGGGGGYFGGGGSCGYAYATAGGGSGYLIATGTATTTTQGSGASVANSADVDYPGNVGNGVNFDVGQDGYVVISYLASPSITVTQTLNGTISPGGNASGTVSVNAGGNQTFAITPNGGYYVNAVVVDGTFIGATSSYTFSNVAGSHSITATYSTSQMFNMNLSRSSGGVIKLGNATTTATVVTATSSISQTYTFVPSAGYYLATVLADGVPVSTSTASYTFSSISGDHTLSVIYAKITKRVTVTQTANGTIYPDTFDIPYGSNKTFYISPRGGYKIATLTVDGSSIATSTYYTFSNATTTHTITATYSSIGATTTKLFFRGDSYLMVPDGATSITVKAWGGGGGGSQFTNGTLGNGVGGGAGFASATIPVSSGDILTINVAGGGFGTSSVSAVTQGGYNGGGNGGGGSTSSGGAGGGFSGVFDNGVTYLVAGGGGGGSAYSSTVLGNGGAGGGITGFNGSGTTGPGIGGTQSAGGSAGTGPGGTGTAGSSLNGGDSCSSTSGGGGGGGAGYYGGGGAGCYSGTSARAGGGGGSSYIISLATASSTLAGTSTTPGGTLDSDYISGTGVGGTTFSNGANGLVVISYGFATTTNLGNGTDPSSVTIAPGTSSTFADAFTLKTTAGTDTVTSVTVSLGTNVATGTSKVEITSDDGSTVYGSSTNLTTDTPTITTTGLVANTTLTQYKIRVTPKTHVNMPIIPGASYSISALITNWTGTNTHSGSDASSAVVTVDNLSPVISASFSWATSTTPSNNNWYSVTYGNGLFVAVACTGTGNRVMTSPDGITWTTRVSAADNCWNSVTYGNGLFVAVSGSGGATGVMTSPDGITWTTRITPAGNYISVTYGNNKFVSVGIGGVVMTSATGTLWTSGTSSVAASWYAIAYGTGTFVAIAPGTTTIMTSPDGITWTTRSGSVANSWNDLTYGNGLFVAVANTGTGNRVMTSPDGITWTTRTSAADNSWQRIVYGNGLFVAVANTGTGNRVMTSPDGITWTTRTSAADNSWNSVAYGNGLFVAVATTGTNDRVMYSYNNITVLPGDLTALVTYTIPNTSDIARTIVLKNTSPITDTPTEGVVYNVGDTIGASTVGCIDTNTIPLATSSCVITGLTNGTAYYFKLFTQDTSGNYSVGVTATTSATSPVHATVNQKDYGFFGSSLSTVPGALLSPQDTAYSIIDPNQIFRLRMLFNVSGTSSLPMNGKQMKLQYAVKTGGACDTSFSGEVYQDITQTTPISFFNVPGVSDDTQLITLSGITDGANTVIPQTLQESGTFTNSVAIPTGSDGEWDFALYNNNALSQTAYCVRAVNADGSLLDSYSNIPEITMPIQNLQISDFIFMKDNGNQTGATAIDTDGAPVTTGFYTGDKARVRFLVSNQGEATAINKVFTLEYSSTTCSTSWTRVPDYRFRTTEEWQTYPSLYLSDGGLTSHLNTLSTPYGQTFTPGAIVAQGYQTNAITLPPGQYTELEYSIKATPSLTPDTNYCFRLTNAGDPSIFSYNAMPQITPKPIYYRPQAGGGAGATYIAPLAGQGITAAVEAPASTATTTVTGGSVSGGGANSTSTNSVSTTTVKVSTTTPTKVKDSGGDSGSLNIKSEFATANTNIFSLANEALRNLFRYQANTTVLETYALEECDKLDHDLLIKDCKDRVYTQTKPVQYITDFFEMLMRR